jgi:hypothetical protein
VKTLNYLVPGALLTAVIALAACGGGGSGPSPVTPGSGAPGPAASAAAKSDARASVSIVVPGRPASSDTRSAKYISSSTQSMTFATVDGTSKATQIASFDLTPTSPGCAAVTGGGTQCTETFAAPSGTSTFSVTAYDATGGKGNVLSTATLQAVLKSGTNNVIPLVLDGNATTATVVLGTSSLPVGSAGTTSVAIQATDAQNNVIVGPGAFSNPIALTITGDTWSTLALSASTITKPGQVLTLAYNGNSLNGAQIMPSATGLSGSGATFAGSGYAVANFGLQSFFTGGDQLYPRSIAALSNGGAVFTFTDNWCSYYGLGFVDAGGNVTLAMGDTSDPMASPTPFPTSSASAPTPSPSGSPSPPPPVAANLTFIQGMSQNITVFSSNTAYSDIAAGSTNNVFYGANFGHFDPIANTIAYTGVIGNLNIAAKTTAEKVLKGQPMQIRTTPDGTVWFTESSGQVYNYNTSTWTYLISPDCGATGENGIGFMTPGGQVTELGFSQLGLNAGDNTYPNDFAIGPSGSGTAIYVADGNTARVIRIPVAGNSLTAGQAGTTIATPNWQPKNIAVGADGTVVWTEHYGNHDPNGNVYYGYIKAGSTFGTQSIVETPYTQQRWTYSDSIVAADGQFWMGADSQAQIARLFNFGAATSGQVVVATQPASSSSLGNCGVSVAGGAVWVAQCSTGSLVRVVYGATGNGTDAASVATRILSAARASGQLRKPSSHDSGHKKQLSVLRKSQIH